MYAETSDIHKNLKIMINNEPWTVVDCQFVKPGKGNAFTRVKIKSLIHLYQRQYRYIQDRKRG